jgi:hypothetical protein
MGTGEEADCKDTGEADCTEEADCRTVLDTEAADTEEVDCRTEVHTASPVYTHPHLHSVVV